MSLKHEESHNKAEVCKTPQDGDFGVLGLIALVLCIRAAIWHSRAEKQRAWAEIQKRLDAIRAAGEPVTADDLAKLYPDPPPEQNEHSCWPLLLPQRITPRPRLHCRSLTAHLNCPQKPNRSQTTCGQIWKPLSTIIRPA